MPDVGHRERAVEALFPQGLHVFALVHDDEFQFHLLSAQSCGVNVGYPFVVVVFVHRHGVFRLPASQRVHVACRHQSFALAQLRCAHFESQCGVVVVSHQLPVGMPVGAVGDGRRVEVGIFGPVNPVVEKAVAESPFGRKFQPVGLCCPLCPHPLAVFLHGVEILHVVRSAYVCVKRQVPVGAVVGVHEVHGHVSVGFGEVDGEPFTVCGPVFQIEVYFHVCGVLFDCSLVFKVTKNVCIFLRNRGKVTNKRLVARLRQASPYGCPLPGHCRAHFMRWAAGNRNGIGSAGVGRDDPVSEERIHGACFAFS